MGGQESSFNFSLDANPLCRIVQTGSLEQFKQLVNEHRNVVNDLVMVYDNMYEQPSHIHCLYVPRTLSLLGAAVKFRKQEHVEYLLENREDLGLNLNARAEDEFNQNQFALNPNEIGENAKTIVQVAVENYDREILLLLLEHGANPNKQWFSAPLEYACATNHLGDTSIGFEIISILLTYGASSDEAIVKQFLEANEHQIKEAQSWKKLDVKSARNSS